MARIRRPSDHFLEFKSSDTTHLQAIGDDHPPITKILSQVTHRSSGCRDRMDRVETLCNHVSRHHHRCSGSARSREGKQVSLADLTLQPWQTMMRIHLHRPDPWIVFPAIVYPVLPVPTTDLGRQCQRQCSVRSKGARSDSTSFTALDQIDTGREVHIDADLVQFLAGDLALKPGQFESTAPIVAGRRSQRQIAGKDGDPLVDSHHSATFLIDADAQMGSQQLSQFSHQVGQPGMRRDVSSEQDHPTRIDLLEVAGGLR